jgi:hypothetical protein
MNTMMLMLLSLGQAPDKFGAEFHPDLRDPKLIDSTMRPTGPGLEQDEHGVRIRLPGGQGKLPPTNLVTNFGVRGDFEATLSYEILRADQPTSGYGVGVSLYAAIDPTTKNAVSLGRRVLTDGATKFVSNRQQPVGPPNHTRFMDSGAAKGKLRILRIGWIVHFLVQEGDADFVELNRVDWAEDDLVQINVGANAGNSDAGLDVRLLDFTLKAEELPRKAAPVEKPPPDDEVTRPRWRSLVPAAIALAMILVASAAAAWWRQRRRNNNAARLPATRPKQ